MVRFYDPKAPRTRRGYVVSITTLVLVMLAAIVVKMTDQEQYQIAIIVIYLTRIAVSFHHDLAHKSLDY